MSAHDDDETRGTPADDQGSDDQGGRASEAASDPGDASPPHRSGDDTKAPLATRLSALAALGRAIHDDEGGPLGGFWPDAVKKEGDHLVVALDRTERPRVRFAARLSSPEHLGDAAFMPPELAERDDVHRAPADAYSFAALVYREATGQAPVGRLDVGRLQRALGRDRFSRVLDGLSADPSLRPTVGELAETLQGSVRTNDARAASTASERPTTGARSRGPVGTRRLDAHDEDAGADDGASLPEPRSFVRPLLMVGGVSIFTGALWFIWLAWGLLTDIPRLVVVSGFTAAVWPTAELLAKHRFDDAAKTLRVLFAQLFWAVGGMCLVVAGALSSRLGWALVAVLVAAVSVAVAVKRGPRALLFLAAAASTLLACTLVYAGLGPFGRVALFIGLSALARLALVVAEGLEIDARGLFGVAHVFANVSAAAHAAYALFPKDFHARFGTTSYDAPDIGHLSRFAVIAVVVAALYLVTRHCTYATRSKALTALTMGAFALGVALLVVPTWSQGATLFALLVPTGAVVEIAIARRHRADASETRAWLVLTSVLWLTACALLADVGQLTSLAVAVVGAALAIFAGVVSERRESALLAATSALHLAIGAIALGDALSTGSAWGPSLYAFACAAVFMALGVVALRGTVHLARAYTATATVFGAGSVLASLALLERTSLMSDDGRFAALFVYAPPALFALSIKDARPHARALGTLGVLSFFAMPSAPLLLEPRSFALALVSVVIGLVGVLLSSIVLDEERATRLLDDGAAAFTRTLTIVATVTTVVPALLHAGRLIGDPLADILKSAMIVALTAGALFGLGMGAEHLGRARVGRTLSLVGALVFLGAFSFAALSVPRDYGHPLLLFIGGAVLLVLGVARRHPHVVLSASTALVIGFWTQFFMKLRSHAPMSVLLIVFGVALLVGAVLYERHVKVLVVRVRAWPGI